MKVRFIENVNISNKLMILSGEQFEAKDEGDFIMIRMKNGETVKAPKSEIDGILEFI